MAHTAEVHLRATASDGYAGNAPGYDCMDAGGSVTQELKPRAPKVGALGDAGAITGEHYPGKSFLFYLLYQTRRFRFLFITTFRKNFFKAATCTFGITHIDKSLSQI